MDLTRGQPDQSPGQTLGQIVGSLVGGIGIQMSPSSAILSSEVETI
jgi:hypothetical protein